MSRVSLLGAVTGTLLVASTSPLHAGVPVQLTKSPAADRHPTWSADGSFIVFESNRSGTDWHLYRIPSGGGEETQISFDALSQMQPEISPDGTRIVYLQAVADMAGGISSSGISVMPTFGGQPSVLVPRGSSIRLLPTWAPDGSTIYFTKGVPTVGNWDIYKVSSTGGPETFVLDFGDDGTSAISPDGQTITWANHPPNKPYNLVQTALANPVTPVQLTFETANTAQPAYSWDGSKLVGLGNAISDGHLVVYYPHLLVLPDHQGRGIGTHLMQMLMARYAGFHQHMLVADGRAIDFYRKCGFERAGKTEPMWIYAGHDH